MEKGKNNKGVIALLVFIIIILLALVVLLATGFVSFKNTALIENQQSKNSSNEQIKNDSNDEVKNNDDNSNTTIVNDSNKVNKVYSSENNTGYYLILWDDGTYKYINNDETSGTLGKYSLNDERLVLYYMFSIDSNNKNKVTIADGMKTLKVVNQSQITDNDIILNLANQSAREGAENFYTNLYSMLKYYDDEQKKELGIN